MHNEKYTVLNTSTTTELFFSCKTFSQWLQIPVFDTHCSKMMCQCIILTLIITYKYTFRFFNSDMHGCLTQLCNSNA